MSRFTGRSALITGGSSGIGKATAARLAAEGARVVINGRNPDRVEAALTELTAPDGYHTGYPLGVVPGVSGVVADISRSDEAEALVAQVVERLGRIDILVNSAGIDGAGVNALELTNEEWQRVLDVNLTGPFLVARAAARNMAENGGGAIVNVASLNGLEAEPNFADYNSSKGGLVMLTRSLAIDLVKHNIRVNAVCPGYILTPMTEEYAADPDVGPAIREAIPMGRFGDPAEVAAAIAFLASDDASYVTGEVLMVDGGRFAGQ
jgi:3-oxoacyl-[acyl-carrier protein] reductase